MIYASPFKRLPVEDYSEENIRQYFYELLNFSGVGGRRITDGNVLEKNNLVKSFKIDNGIIEGKINDLDNNIYNSKIDLNISQYKNIIINEITNKDITLANILHIINGKKIRIVPESFHNIRYECTCNNNDEKPCKHTIALYFQFIDNIKMDHKIILKLFGINTM